MTARPVQPPRDEQNEEQGVSRVDTLSSANSPIATTAGEHEVAHAPVVPESRLPFTVGSPNAGTDPEIECGLHDRDGWTICDFYTTSNPDCEIESDPDLALAYAEYVARCCNAFPQLVEALTATTRYLQARHSNASAHGTVDADLIALIESAQSALQIAEGTGE